jgi:hypothetical protein
LLEDIAHNRRNVRNNHDGEDHASSQNTDTERRACKQGPYKRNRREDIPHRLLEVGRKQRGKDKQTPHAVNDTGDGRQQFDGDTERASQPARRQLRQEQGDTKAYGNRNQQGDERGHQRAVNRHQRTKDFVWRVPLFGPQEGETEFLDARPGGKNQRHDNAAQQQ